MKNLRYWNWIFYPALALVLAACDGIPEAYQGEYFEDSHGIRVKMYSTEVEIETDKSEAVSYQPKELNYENLDPSKPGVYVRKGQNNEKLMDVYYVIPKPASRKSESNFSWFEADIMFTTIDARTEQTVKQISFVHCEKGNFMFDNTSKSFELGCPPNPEQLLLKRKKQAPVSNGGWFGNSN